jgi:gliding motility-associated-like protein
VVSPAGGTFSAPPGLVLNATTGVVDLAASTPGLYSISYAVTSPCPASNSAVLRVVPLPPAFSYACPPFYQNGAAVTPSAVPAGGRFSASPAGLGLNASTGAVDLANSSVGNYTITFTSAGRCTSTTAFQVVDKLVFPNVITPNGDGQNDALRPRLFIVSGYRLAVYNRWGRRVHESNDAAQGWTAADNSPGMYYYRVDYSDCTGVFHTLKSWLEVIK